MRLRSTHRRGCRSRISTAIRLPSTSRRDGAGPRPASGSSSRSTARARVGFAALDVLDGAPYLDQLSVRRAAMQKGAGRFLLSHAVTWATERRATHLWLTTYGHLAWNRPFYERDGFVVVPEEECSPGVRHHLDAQRRALPAPEHRVAMRRTLGS